MKIDIKLVVIYVNFNNSLDTYDSIKSLYNSTFNSIFTIVVDNNSKEKNKLSKLYSLNNNIKILYNSENLGFGKANNLGIKWAQENLNFDYLLILNNDTLLEKNALQHLLNIFQENNEIGIVTGKILFNDNREMVWYGGGEINILRGKPLIFDFRKKASENGANKPKFVSFISGCAMMFSRPAINDLGGFDEDFFMYAEDLELSIRAIKFGYKLYYEPKAIIYHKVQGSFSKKVKTKSGLSSKNPNLHFLFFHMKSNQWITFRKHLSGMKFFKFNLFFWIDYFFLVIKLLIFGRYDILEISLKTISKIIRYTFNAKT